MVVHVYWVVYLKGVTYPLLHIEWVVKTGVAYCGLDNYNITLQALNFILRHQPNRVY